MKEQKKVVLVTGASSGIGYYTALALAKEKAVVILLCRNSRQSIIAQEKLVKQSNNPDIHLFTADLSHQCEIREVATKIIVRFSKIDVLINNAACVTSEFQLTKDGVEMQWAVNHLAPFLLTHLLLPALKNSEQGRIINITSRAHRFAQGRFPEVFTPENYSGNSTYNQTKLANILFTYCLAQKLANTSVTVNCAYPGLVNTDIALKHNSLFRQWFWRAIRVLGVSPKKGAETILYLATSALATNKTGKYFGQLSEQKSSDLSYNRALAEQLWNLSALQTGIH